MKLIMENWKRYLSEAPDRLPHPIGITVTNPGGVYPDQVALKLTQRTIRSLEKLKKQPGYVQPHNRLWYKERFDIDAASLDTFRGTFSHYPAIFVKAYDNSPTSPSIARSGYSGARGGDRPPPRNVIEQIRYNCKEIIKLLNSIPDSL